MLRISNNISTVHNYLCKGVYNIFTQIEKMVPVVFTFLLNYLLDFHINLSVESMTKMSTSQARGRGFQAYTTLVLVGFQEADSRIIKKCCTLSLQSGQ